MFLLLLMQYLAYNGQQPLDDMSLKNCRSSVGTTRNPLYFDDATDDDSTSQKYKIVSFPKQNKG